MFAVPPVAELRSWGEVRRAASVGEAAGREAAAPFAVTGETVFRVAAPNGLTMMGAGLPPAPRSGVFRGVSPAPPRSGEEATAAPPNEVGECACTGLSVGEGREGEPRKADDGRR